MVFKTPPAGKTNFWVYDLSRSQHAIFQKQPKSSALDSLPQILHESLWNFYLQDKFMAFSLSFFALLKDLNKLYFCPAFQHFLLWPEPQLLNAILNLALWSWKLWWNYSIIHFKAGACVSRWWHPCDWLGYKAICGLRGQKSGLIFVVELTLA